MDHDEAEGHLCAASMHTCGELCSLVKNDNNRLCSRPCVLDWWDAQYRIPLGYPNTRVAWANMIAILAIVHFLVPWSASLHLATVSAPLGITSTRWRKMPYIFAGSYYWMFIAVCSSFFRQEHACPHLCELGICEIVTKPQLLESTFTGRHAKFQYTKVRLFLPMLQDSNRYYTVHSRGTPKQLRRLNRPTQARTWRATCTFERS